MSKKHKFSIIIPIYNTEDYLCEAIDSIVHQTIGFEENIQLILVNDGSTDKSAAICEEYKSRFPENIVYVEQENQGASVARNTGLKYAKADILNFLDSDDMWAPDACEKAEAFFKKNDVKIVAGRRYYFGRRIGFRDHTDFKFEKTAVIDIFENPEFSQLHAASCFIKRELMEEVAFHNRLKIQEDALLLTEIILKEKRYGVCREMQYNYRKRDSMASVLDSKVQNKSWYIDTVEIAYKGAFDLSKRFYGKIIPYVQWLVMYELQWRFNKTKPNCLSEEEYAQYLQAIRELLLETDDIIIFNAKDVSPLYKLFAFKLKYNKNVLEDATVNDNLQLVMSNGSLIFELKRRRNVRINGLEIEDNTLIIEGLCEVYELNKGYEIIAKDNCGNTYTPEIYFEERYKQYAMDGTIVNNGTSFRLEIPIKIGMRIKILLTKEGKELCSYTPIFDSNAKLDNHNRRSYYTYDKYIVLFRKKSFNILSSNLIMRSVLKRRYEKSLS